MSRRDDEVLIEDIIEHAQLALESARGKSREDQEIDRVFRAATERFIEITGEAASRISDDTRDSFPNVLWQKIVSTRNFLAHGYSQIDLDILWNILTIHLPLLVRELE